MSFTNNIDLFDPASQEKSKIENLLPEHAVVLALSDNYAVYHLWEDAFLFDIGSRETHSLGSYYGDPEIALIYKDEQFALAVGQDCMGVFDIPRKKLRLIETDIQEWIYSIDHSGKTVEIICENGKRYSFDI